MLKRCIYCGGEIKPTADFFKQNGEEGYKKMKEKFKEEFGYELPESEDFNCIECGQGYNKNLNPIELKLSWLR